MRHRLNGAGPTESLRGLPRAHRGASRGAGSLIFREHTDNTILRKYKMTI